MTQGAANRSSKKKYPRPTKQGMAGRIQQQIAAIKDQHGADLVKGDDLYEIFIFTEVRSAVHKITGVLPILKLRTTGEFVVRRGPGNINNKIFSWAEFTHEEVDYEIHIGVRAKGLSSVAHESDVSIIEVREAQASRSRKNSPYPLWRYIPLIVECKYYSAGLPLNFGRSLIGSLVEFPRSSCALVSNSDAKSITHLSYRYKYYSGYHYFQRSNINFSPLYTLNRSKLKADILGEFIEESFL